MAEAVAEEEGPPPPPPPLPEFLINWSSVGIRIETLLPVDPETLVNSMNEVGRPAFSMAIADVNVLVTEELAIDPPTELGEKLKAAQETGEPEWLTPELVNVVLEARSIIDRDYEHRLEEQRRIQYAETCKTNIEEAKAKETEASQQLEDALKNLKDFEARMKELEAKHKELEQRPSYLAAAAAATAAALGGGSKGSKKGSAKTSVKGSAKAPAKGSVKGSVKGSASAQVLSTTDERKFLEDNIAKINALVQSCEKKVKMAEYLDRKQEAEKLNPLTTTRIYWCLGLGDTAEELSKQATVKHMFKAIFNLAKKPLPPPPPPEETVEVEGGELAEDGAAPPPPPELAEPPEPTPVPPFIEELHALAQASKLDHPSRKIPVLDVLYEDPPPPKVEPPVEGVEPTEPPPPSPEPPPGDLSYAQLAKAVASGIVCLQQQFEAFSKLETSITGNYEIPEAIPKKDVNVTYYKALLNAVPSEWVSIPVLLYCMVEQVAYYDCSLEDMEALEVARNNQRLAKGFDNSIQRLGVGLSCIRRSSDLLNEIIEEIKLKQAEEDMQTAGEMLTSFLKIAGEEAERRLEEAEKLAKEAEEAAAKLAEEKAAAVAAGEREPSIISIEADKTKSSRKASRLNLLQQSAGDEKKSSKLDRKSSKEERNSSRKPSAVDKSGEKKLSRTGSGLTQRGSQRQASAKLWDPAANEISELLEDYANRQDEEEHSLVVHEFSRVGRVERTLRQKSLDALEFLDSVDVVVVEKHMLSLFACPGKNRASMPIFPFLSDGKRGASLEALRWFVGGQSEPPTKDLYSTHKHAEKIHNGRFPIEETLWRPEVEKAKTGPMNLAAIQRYKKLKMFLEMLLQEEKRAFNLHDDVVKDLSESVDAVTPKEEPDDGLTEEERRELDKRNNFLTDCGCQNIKPPEKKCSLNAPLELDLSSLSLPPKPREMFLPFQSIIDRRFMEAFPDGLLGDVYGRARTRLPYRVCRYDRDEDCILEVLYADERDHVWQGVAASQIGFGDYVAMMDHPSPAMKVIGKHSTYDVEEQYAIVLERFKCHLTEDQGLVWTGLPAKSDIQWEPQTTVIKDGHLILLRAYGPDDSSKSPTEKSVFACLRDGLVVSFFIAEDGTMTMQVTNPESQTIEITSKGIVRMFASHLHAKAEENEESAAPADGDGAAAARPPPPQDAGAESEEAPVEEEPVNKQTMRDFLLKEKGDLESWRCILPTGTVVRYRNNGDAQVLYSQGNVSDFRNDYEGGACWVTANSEGFLVIQREPPPGETPAEGEVPPEHPIEGTAPAKKASIKKGSKKEEVPAAEKKGSTKKGSIKKGSLTEVPAELIREEATVPVPEPVGPKRPILTQLPNLKVVHFYDPDTGDDVMTREDLVVVIKSQTKKSTFVQHADGTQMYSEVTETDPSPEHVQSQGELMMAQIMEVYPANPLRVKDEPKHPEGEGDGVGEGGEELEDGEKRGSVAGEGTKRSVVGGEKKGSLKGAEIKKGSLTGAVKNGSVAGAEKKGSMTGTEKKQSLSEFGVAIKPSTRPSLLLQPPPPKPEITTTWHVHKDGLARVQGKFGSETQQSGVCVELNTVDGLYAATWSKDAGQLSLSMPGGATLYAVGNSVSFDPSDGSKKHDPYQTEGDDRKHGPFVNTNRVYVFDVVEGSLTFTDNAGEGFKIFGRGTEWETIKGGKTATQAAEEAEFFKILLLQHTAAVPEGLEADLIAGELAKYFPNDPPPADGDPNAPPADPNALRTSVIDPRAEKEGSIKGEAPKKGSVKADAPKKETIMVDARTSSKGSKLGSMIEISEEDGPPKETYIPVDIYEGFELSPLGERKTFPGSRPATATPPPSEPPEEKMLGPYPRLFVIHEGGHGYEFLTEEVYQLYELTKFYDKRCTKNIENYIFSDEEVVFHTFVTVEGKKQMEVSELVKDSDKAEHTFPLSCTLPASRRVSLAAKRVQGKQRNNKLQAQTKYNWLQLQFALPKMPRVINPIIPDVDPKQDEVGLVYRQIAELPYIDETTRKKFDEMLEELVKWQWVNLELQEIEIIPDTRTDEDILMERYIACRIRESKKYQKRETIRKSRLSEQG